jgi:hypothetical protein
MPNDCPVTSFTFSEQQLSRSGLANDQRAKTEILVEVVVGVEVVVEVVVVVVVGVDMKLSEWQQLSTDGFTPLPGRCIIHLDRPSAMSTSGTIHIPDSARVQDVKATGYMGTVLAVNPLGEWKRDKTTFDSLCWLKDAAQFKAGDRVLVGLHMDDLTEEVVVARNGQVDAVVTE